MNLNINRTVTMIILAFLIPSISIASTSQSVININYSKKHLQEMPDQQSFSTILYALITADAEQFPVNAEIFHSFFTPDLLSQYEKVAALDAKRNDVGCLNDFNHFTGAQENSAGFWIGTITTKGSSFFVPVYLNFDNVFNLKKPNVILQLIKSSTGFEIEDIHYSDSEKRTLRSIIKACLAPHG